MHSRGIAHRDLSLENVMLHQSHNGSVDAYVIDLGVAVVNPLGATSPVFLCPGASLACEKPGKAMYISPELWSGHEWEAYSNDVFSLGVLLYCMLMGRQPFNSSVDIWARFITSGKWQKVLQVYESGHIHPDSMEEADYIYWIASFDHLSRSSLDLIQNLLCPQPQRITLEQLQRHSWMKQKQNFNTPFCSVLF